VKILVAAVIAQDTNYALRNQENVTPNPCAEKRGQSLHFVVKPKHNQKNLKKKRKKKRTSKPKKKKRDVCHFQLGRKNWIVAMDNDSWNH